MIIYVDIDNTICKTDGTDYAGAVPYIDRIERVNGWMRDGHVVVYWTARGSGSGVDYRELTERQLAEWGCTYCKLLFGKPVYDVFIEDRSAFFEPLGIPAELR